MLIRPGSLPITSTYVIHAPDPVAAARPSRSPAPQITPAQGVAHPENDSRGGGYANNSYGYIRHGGPRAGARQASAGSASAAATYASAPEFHKTDHAESIAEQKRATRKIDPKKPSGPRPSFDQTTLEAEYARQRSEGLAPVRNYRAAWSASAYGAVTNDAPAHVATPSQPPKNARLHEASTAKERRIPLPDTGTEQATARRKSAEAPVFFVTQPAKSSHKVDISV